MIKTYPFTIDDLPYGYEDLEPVIDKETMILHHDKHHQAYADNLNKLLDENNQWQTKSLDELLSSENIGIKNNAGGVWNHDFFWKGMAKPSSSKMSEDLKKKIENDFGSIDEFKLIFEKTAVGRFGSGWGWLVVNKDGNLEIMSTANQDNPMVDGLKPILAVDVWEHAYYLKYKNKRGDWVKAFWDIVNWDKVEELFKA